MNEESQAIRNELLVLLGAKPEEFSLPPIPHLTTETTPAQAFRIAKRLLRNDHRRRLTITMTDLRLMLRKEFAQRRAQAAKPDGTFAKDQLKFLRDYEANTMRMARKQMGLTRTKLSYAAEYREFWNWISVVVELAAKHKVKVWQFVQQPNAAQEIRKRQCSRQSFVRRVNLNLDRMLLQIKRLSGITSDIIVSSLPGKVTKSEARNARREISQHYEQQFLAMMQPLLNKRGLIIKRVTAKLYGKA